MYKFNPTEKPPCPKCGTDIDVATHTKKYMSAECVAVPYIKIECTGCGHWIRRRPLDYLEDRVKAKEEKDE